MPEIRAEFTHHVLSNNGRCQADTVAEIFSDCLTRLDLILPTSRVKSIAVTKLQEACLFAQRAVAELPANQAED
jgi:hypothetical protein